MTDPELSPRSKTLLFLLAHAPASGLVFALETERWGRTGLDGLIVNLGLPLLIGGSTLVASNVFEVSSRVLVVAAALGSAVIYVAAAGMRDHRPLAVLAVLGSVAVGLWRRHAVERPRLRADR